jgi:hypothetical protein
MNIHELRYLHEQNWRQSYPHFIKVIQHFDLRVGVEVGVAFGGHAEAILEQTKVTQLVGVDPYQHMPSNYDDMMNLPQEDFDNLFWYTVGRLSRFGKRYTHVRYSSEDAVRQVDGVADFVYLDANHGYEAVKQDLELWTPKVGAGGVIGGHDFAPEFPGVRQAVEEFATAHHLQVTLEPLGVWWAQLTK